MEPPFMPPSRWCILLIAANSRSEEEGISASLEYEQDHVGAKNHCDLALPGSHCYYEIVKAGYSRKKISILSPQLWRIKAKQHSAGCCTGLRQMTRMCRDTITSQTPSQREAE